MAAAAKSKVEAIEISKVRNNRKSILIEWTQGSDNYSVTFHDNPLKSFYTALDALNPHVCELCEFSAKDAEKISSTGITVASDGENSKAVIVARKRIKKGKRIFNIATPILSMYPDEENKTTEHMDEAQAKAIEKVISEAIKYINGDRAQGQIKFEEEKPEPKPDAGSNTEKFPQLGEPGP